MINEKTIGITITILTIAALLSGSGLAENSNFAIPVFAEKNDNNDNHDDNNNDKVKVNCKDVAFALVTLELALGDLDEEGADTLDDELQEGEIANDVDELNDNFQNVLDEVNDECEDVGFLGFVEFE